MKYILVAIILLLETNSLYVVRSHRAEPEVYTRFSGWLNGTSTMPFWSLTPAEQLTAFFRAWSSL